jgi:hypothetical protein
MKHRFYVFSAITFAVLASISCSKPTGNFEYASAFYKIQLTDSAPFIRYFSVDALGDSMLDYNPIRWKSQEHQTEYELLKISGSKVKICRKGSGNPHWLLKFEKKQFKVVSYYRNDTTEQGLEFRFDKRKNHATLLGLMEEKRKTRLPAVLHLPDMGTFQIKADLPGTTVNYDASRHPGNEFISLTLPGAKKNQGTVSYTFHIASIYPQFEGVGQDKYAGFRRNYLNLFQINPVFQVLANNSCSDPVAFTLYLSSMLALETPCLVDSLSALDLVRMSVERYLNGMKAYGLTGYGTEGYEGTEVAAWNSPYNSLDAYPSLVISACNYIKGSNNIAWANRYFPRIKEWMDIQMKRDYDGNGLVEYELSGNSGSWNGIIRPANWWDTIGFGHEDAFSNAITYEALNLLVMVAEMIGSKNDAIQYRQLATKMKKNYFQTFYNPKTGVLAGWKSKDGKLHDYYFIMVNSMAVYYNLVPADQTKKVLMTLWKKMQEVGYTDFSLGVPGNLISIRKEDYTHPDPRWGGGQLEDGSDAFQRYENGGASINWSYFTLRAFQKAGLDEQFDRIADGILEGISTGAFQGLCTEGGMTRDWKSWSGECWGYEGYLCDGYLALLAFNPEDK